MEQPAQLAPRQHNRSRAVIALIAVTVALVLLILNWLYGELRWEQPGLDLLTLAVTFLLPLACLLILAACPPGRWRPFAAVLYVLAAGVGLLLLAGLCLVPLVWKVETLQTVPVGSSQIRIYRTNGGATTSFGIIVQQERSLLLGLKRVKELHSVSPAGMVNIKVVDSRHVRLSYPPYGDRRPNPVNVVVELREW